MAEHDVRAEIKEIRELLQGKDYDRTDTGLLGEMREVKRFMRALLRWGQIAGAFLLTVGSAVVVKLLTG